MNSSIFDFIISSVCWYVSAVGRFARSKKLRGTVVQLQLSYELYALIKKIKKRKNLTIFDAYLVDTN